VVVVVVVVVVQRRRWYPGELIRESVEWTWWKVEELRSFYEHLHQRIGWPVNSRNLPLWSAIVGIFAVK